MLNLPALVFNGLTIDSQGDMLCLTAMWRAAGSDRAKQPSNWLASAQAQDFIEFLTPGISGSLTSTTEGRNGGTWAHWQVGIAYAKYLSPELHAYVNSVFRAHIEQRGESLPALIDARLARLEQGQEAISAQIIDIRHYMATKDDAQEIKDGMRVIGNAVAGKRKDAPPENRKIYDRVIALIYKTCPCGCGQSLFDKNGKPFKLHAEHFNGRNNNGLYDMWLTLANCNQRLVDLEQRALAKPAFQVWVSHVKRIAKEIEDEKIVARRPRKRSRRCDGTPDMGW